MDSVLTLVAAPGKIALDASTADAARRALQAAGGRAGPADWLGPNEACDVPFAGADRARAQAAVRAALTGKPVDLVAQPLAGRRKRLLVADMDATMTVGETIDELAAAAGVGPRIAAITAAAMRGDIDFPAALKQRVALLKGLPETELLRVRDAMRPMPGARALVATMRRHGAHAVLVSGGFDVFTSHARMLLGFDEARGNRLEMAGRRLTGRVLDPILGRDAKLEALTAASRARGIAMAETMAVGDGANDLAMIRAAGLGVAFHAKPVVAEAARARVDHGDLTALLYMQGYRRAEFAD
ncbi:MAG: phosphoserine phosphatase SerB [Rhodospirillales bacterium]